MADKEREPYARTDVREYKHRYTFKEANELLPELLYKKDGTLTDFGSYLKDHKRTVTYSDYKVGKNLDDSGYTRTDSDDKFKDQIERLGRAESAWVRGKLAERSMASRTPRTLSLGEFNRARDAQAMKFTLNGQQRMAPIEYRGRLPVVGKLVMQAATLDKIDDALAKLKPEDTERRAELTQKRNDVAGQTFDYDVRRPNGTERNVNLALAAAADGRESTSTVKLSVGRNASGRRVISAVDPNFDKSFDTTAAPAATPATDTSAPPTPSRENEVSNVLDETDQGTRSASKGGKVGPKKQKNRTKKPALSGKARKRKPRIRK